MRWLETAASSDAHAQLSLGKALLLGTSGTEYNYPRALRLLHQSTDKGDTAVAYYLGVMHRSGYDTAVGTVRATHWFDRATYHKTPVTTFMLADAYRDGDGAPCDGTRALVLYQGAIEHELPEVVQALAMAYQSGELGPKRDDAAYYQQ